jgi:hypothetical protein
LGAGIALTTTEVAEEVPVARGSAASRRPEGSAWNERHGRAVAVVRAAAYGSW